MGPLADCCLQCKAIILILPLLWTDVSSQVLPGFNLMAPRNVRVQEGLCVHIPCTFRLPPMYTLSRDAQGIWIRRIVLGNKFEEFLKGSEFLNNRNKLFVIGDVWRGDCSLMINNAKQEDADYYTFRLEDGNLKYTFSNYRTLVTVIELTEQPEISPVGTIVAGKEVTLSCTSPGRCSGKPPLMTWEGKAKIKKEEMYTIIHEDGTTTLRSNVTFIPSIEDDQLVLTCTVTFGNNVTTSNSISLNVTDSPSMESTTPGCRSVDSIIIAGMVVGNIVILILIIVGICCFLKRHAERRPRGNEFQNQGSRKQGTERTYEDLTGQNNDIYHNLRTQ